MRREDHNYITKTERTKRQNQMENSRASQNQEAREYHFSFIAMEYVRGISLYKIFMCRWKNRTVAAQRICMASSYPSTDLQGHHETTVFAFVNGKINEGNLNERNRISFRYLVMPTSGHWSNITIPLSMSKFRSILRVKQHQQKKKKKYKTRQSKHAKPMVIFQASLNHLCYPIFLRSDGLEPNVPACEWMDE